MIKVPISAETIAVALPREIAIQVTPAQFYAIAAANRDLRLELSNKGELIVNPPTGGESGKRNFNLIGQLARWCEEYEQLGEGFDSSTGFILPNGAIISPDVAWVRRERWQSLTLTEQHGFIPLSPDFVVELRSSSDNLSKLQAKMQEYIDNGVRLAWLIDPQLQTVTIYRPNAAVEVLAKPLTLSGEDILPGFMLNLAKIWF
jgi:Uma2 family endonuclease